MMSKLSDEKTKNHAPTNYCNKNVNKIQINNQHQQHQSVEYVFFAYNHMTINFGGGFGGDRPCLEY